MIIRFFEDAFSAWDFLFLDWTCKYNPNTAHLSSIVGYFYESPNQRKFSSFEWFQVGEVLLSFNFLSLTPTIDNSLHLNIQNVILRNLNKMVVRVYKLILCKAVIIW